MDKDVNWQIDGSTKDHLDGWCSAPIIAGSTIWFARSGTGLAGMVAVDPGSGTAASMTPYPASFVTENRFGMRRSTPCKLKGDCILLMDVNHGHSNCTMFNTKTRMYSDFFSLEGQLGCGASCVVIGNFLHFFNAAWHDGYIIYTLPFGTTQNVSRQYRDRSTPSLGSVALVKNDGFYKSSNKTMISRFAHNQTGNRIPSAIVDLISTFCIFELFRFGGFDQEKRDQVDSFYVGTLKNEDPTKPIQWKLVPEYTLLRPLRAFGYIQHNHFIVTFGGETREWLKTKKCEREFDIDDIYILNLNKSDGWIKSPIKCPEKATYRAVLDNEERVHLIVIHDTEKKHYHMDLKNIIG